ncbi:MAG: glycosyltransferase family 39 protein, partial [Bacteroidetes bacterium]|nr:glycosyltransferase family 39 protein [Bacteroidota bacterium]
MKLKPIHFIIFWTILNLLQAGFTELTSDEGYYWFYSTLPQWGYYDHPPFIGWIVGLGYSVFHNEFGVRIINTLLSSGGLWLFFSWLPQEWKEKKTIYLLLLAASLANYLSFIIFPDGPLLFFSLVFLTLYKKFIYKQDWGTALLIGLSAALMLYSKYHGILIIGFTVISNLKLLRSKYFYAAALVLSALMIPHFLWQQSEGFPSFAFHLSGRISSFSTQHVFEYISQQVFAIGPSLIFIPFVTKVKDQFEKTLLYIIVGTFLFFLFSSFKTFVHFHWTSITVYPLLYFSVKYFFTTGRQRLLLWLTVPFILFLFVFRLQLMVQVFPFTHLNVDYYHGRKTWAKEMASIADGRPIAFVDNFREAGLY